MIQVFTFWWRISWWTAKTFWFGRSTAIVYFVIFTTIVVFIIVNINCWIIVGIDRTIWLVGIVTSDIRSGQLIQDVRKANICKGYSFSEALIVVLAIPKEDIIFFLNSTYWDHVECTKLFWVGVEIPASLYKIEYCSLNYRTRAIITRGLYTFYPLFEAHLCTVTFGLKYG